MKARVNATGEIVEVVRLDECMRGIVMYKTAEGDIYTKDSLEFDYYNNPDYWTRLEHQAGIAAMQGMLNNSYLAGEFRKDPNNGIEDMSKIITKAAAVYAHALVEKMKEKEEMK